MTLVTGFFFFSSFTCYLFLFVVAAKELWTEMKKTEILLNTIFIFKVYDYFCGWGERFPESVQITMILGQGVKGIPGIILTNSESSLSSIMGLMVCYVSQVCQYERAARRKALTDVCAQRDSREKKGPSVKSSCVKVTEEEFLFGTRCPSFQACALEIINFLLIHFISYLFYFYFYGISFMGFFFQSPLIYFLATISPSNPIFLLRVKREDTYHWVSVNNTILSLLCILALTMITHWGILSVTAIIVGNKIGTFKSWVELCVFHFQQIPFGKAWIPLFPL